MALFLGASTVDGFDLQRVHRYSLHTLAAKPSQIDLLSAVIDTHFPSHVETVGTAINYILHRSGYRHVTTTDIEPTLQLSLPEAHRSLGPLDLRSAVKTIVGPPWQLHEDASRRIMWFQRVGAEPIDPTPSHPPVPHPVEPKVETAPIDSSDNINSSTGAKSKIWHLQASKTLRENLENWVQLNNWSLEWRSRHDYAITHSSTFHGTMIDAVGSLLEHYREAPVPLVAKFFNGNSVLVIGPGVSLQVPSE